MGNLVADVLNAVADAGEPTQVSIRLDRPLTPDQLMEISSLWRDLQIEQTAEGDLIIMAPAGGETGYRNSEIARQLANWSRQDGRGRSFDSSTGFILPNGAERAPDASWVLRERLATLTPEEKRHYLPLCPDFVVELRSPSDRLAAAQAKMGEYRANGARLGWLIDPEARRVHVYRPATAAPQVLDNPTAISGDPELPGFTLDLTEIWEPDL
jgi:Uma2 family endonuclease